LLPTDLCQPFAFYYQKVAQDIYTLKESIHRGI
uniref:Transposase n=1 Tax=Haemonchus placei TaxID=6290 RepID=A0A0N4XA28_HAEPC